MAANGPEIEAIRNSGKEIMQSYCNAHKQLFKMGDSNTNIGGVFCFVGKDKILESNTHRGHSIFTQLGQSNITTLTIQEGMFLVTTDDPENYDYIKNTYSTQEQIDRPLMIAIKIEDLYHFVGLAGVGAGNKIGVFSIIENLSNDFLRKQLILATDGKDYLACFSHKDKFFNNNEFKRGINLNERGHAAAEIRRLAALPGKKKIKAQKRIGAIESTLRNNDAEQLHGLFKKECALFSYFFHHSQQKTNLPLTHRKLSLPPIENVGNSVGRTQNLDNSGAPTFGRG